MTPQILQNVQTEYPDYLRDESRRTGTADSISFPASEQNIRDILQSVRSSGMKVTIQGARTGITAGAVPEGGHIMNLSRMNRIRGMAKTPDGSFTLTVQPGVLLTDVKKCLTSGQFDTSDWTSDSLNILESFRHAGSFFFPPDPTEDSASIGGMVACNASGALSFHYGATRRHIRRIRVVLPDSSVISIARGTTFASGRNFSLKTDSGREIKGTLPSYKMPDVKSAAGYFVEDNMDMIDLFIGAEGTIGIISEIEIRLLPLPAAIWGLAFFMPAESSAIDFVEKIRKASAKPVAIEFFDSRALSLLRRQKQNNPAFAALPEIKPDWHTGLYIEYHGDDACVENAMMEASGLLVECGGNENATWMATDEKEMHRLKMFRHAIPEAVNLLIDERRKTEPRLTKLGTDLAVPDPYLSRAITLYHTALDGAKLEYVIFGHIGNNHVHVNIIPENLAEYDVGKKLYLEWAKRVIAWGGTVSAEHGIGKLKTALLREMYADTGIAAMKTLRKLFDPDSSINSGNLFGE